MKAPLVATIAGLLLLVVGAPAGADSRDLADPRGDVSRVGWDIRSLSYSHSGGGRLVHRLELRGPWSPSALERGGKAAMRFVFAPGGSNEWRYAVQVLWHPEEKRLVAALLDLSKKEQFQKEVRVRALTHGVKVTLRKWDLNRPRRYALGAFTAIDTSRAKCDKGFSNGSCRDSVGFSGNFVHTP